MRFRVSCTTLVASMFVMSNVSFTLLAVSLIACRLHATAQSGYTFDQADSSRAIALMFLETTLALADPSTISPWMLSYTVNSSEVLQKKPFLLDADIGYPFGIGGKKWYSGKYINCIHVTPAFRVRVFAEDSTVGDVSLPVRTPSFIPRITYFASWRPFWTSTEKTKHYVGFSAFHHSNGQDGVEILPDGEVNYYNGNFNEDLAGEFIYGGLMSYTKVRPVDTNTKAEKRLPYFTSYFQKSVDVRTLFWKGSYEHHFLTTDTFDHYDLYGRSRVNLTLGYIYSPFIRDAVSRDKRRRGEMHTPGDSIPIEIRRLVLNVAYIPGHLNRGNIHTLQEVPWLDAVRLNAVVTYYERVFLRNTPNASLFMQVVWYGSDPYNIYFPQSTWQFRAGISFGNIFDYKSYSFAGNQQ